MFWFEFLSSRLPVFGLCRAGGHFAEACLQSEPGWGGGGGGGSGLSFFPPVCLFSPCVVQVGTLLQLAYSLNQVGGLGGGGGGGSGLSFFPPVCLFSACRATCSSFLLSE